MLLNYGSDTGLYFSHQVNNSIMYLWVRLKIDIEASSKQVFYVFGILTKFSAKEEWCVAVVKS
jgi:hypothetical protein